MIFCFTSKIYIHSLKADIFEGIWIQGNLFFVGHLCLQVMAAIGTHPAYIKVLDLSQLCIFLHVNTFSQICMYAGYQCLL